MEKKQKNEKLQLKKQAISNLSKTELENVNGGVQQEFTTSWNNCTGWTCCGDGTTSITIVTIISVIVTITIVV
jgi:hypothetical protein